MRMRSCTALAGLLAALSTAQADGQRPGTPAGSAEQDPASQLPALTVSASPVSGYSVPDASTATKTDTPIMETPVSVQVIPQQVLQDTQARSLPDAVNGKVSGVLGRTGGGFLYDNFVIRGFSDTSGFGTAYRNGLINRQDIYDVSNIERIEILKGPASVLYGRIEPGGMVNYVTKRPLDEPYYAIQQQIGNYHQQRTSLDLTSPVDDDHTLLYRLNAAYQNNESFRDFVASERTFIAPVVTWRPNAHFEVNVELEYKRDRFQADMGIPAVGDRPAPIPTKRSLTDGPGRQFLEELLIAYDWTWRLNENWKVTQRFHWRDWTLDHRQTLPRRLAVDNRTLDRWQHNASQKVETQVASLDINGHFELLGTRHNLLIGVDDFRSETRSPSNFSPAPSIDIYNPIYGQIDFDALSDNGYFYRKQRWNGIYIQDQITLGGRLHLLLGGRYDWTKSGQNFSPTSVGDAKSNRDDLTNNQFSPRAGLLYELTDALSTYASYSKSFGINNGLAADGSTFDPEQAEQYEIGFKGGWFNQRLTGSLALFELTRDNLRTADLSNPGFQVLTGKAKSTGLEFDLAGQLTDHLKLLATYAYTNVRYTRNNDGLEGNRFENAPRHQGSLWTNYQLNAELNGALGVIAVGKRKGDRVNSFQLPGYGRVDAMLSYAPRLGPSRMRLQLNIYNLLDKKYYANSGGSRWNIMPGAPRSILGSVRFEF